MAGTASGYSQSRFITGQVTDRADGLPLPGVNIQVKDTPTGTVTDVDGNYELRVPAGSAALVFT
ncbi:MAG: carboxypeptidase-like regulatory domain-containing protein, partial [Phaeodactylibacter sp.]|nr:carboxypeptidase-like regulatory domain-containing protein [Phaeodactylibacter sp.]